MCVCIRQSNLFEIYLLKFLVEITQTHNDTLINNRFYGSLHGLFY